jgi:hypothetical protein
VVAAFPLTNLSDIFEIAFSSFIVIRLIPLWFTSTPKIIIRIGEEVAAGQIFTTVDNNCTELVKPTRIAAAIINCKAMLRHMKELWNVNFGHIFLQ